MILNMFEKLTIPNTLAAGPGPDFLAPGTARSVCLTLHGQSAHLFPPAAGAASSLGIGKQ